LLFVYFAKRCVWRRFNIIGRISPGHRWANFDTIRKVGKFCLYVIVIFATALFGGWLGNFVDMLIQSNQIELPGDWTVRHWLWIGGAVFGAIGYPMGWITINGHAFKLSRNDDNKKQQTQESLGNEPTEIDVPAKVFSSAAMFGLLGAFLGVSLGGSLLLIWFSLSMSPWPPAGWMESVSVKSADLSSVYLSSADQSAVDGSLQRNGGMTTSHPIAIYCFLGPVVLLGILGVFIGGVGAACGWIRDIPTKKRGTS
jgi:hypothetical protein|tara:strand:- start:1075 stop:1839 length:765 start_codon:yes stop_codon:yes gene_type:complete